MAQCRKMVGKGYVAHPCEVEVNASGGHDGPCMSRDQPRSVTEREQWQEAQDALGAFQREGTPNSFMVEGDRTHPDRRRTFRQEKLGVVEAREGRWCVSLGYDDEWLPIVDYLDKGANGAYLIESPLDKLPAYVNIHGEVALVTDKREPSTPHAQAQMYVCGGDTFRARLREHPEMPGWTAEGGFLPMPEAMKSTLDDWTKPIPMKPEAVSLLEEPPPTPGEGDVWLEIISDMNSRRDYGIEKYGQSVQIFNGRSPRKDAYAEVLDLLVYLKQDINESEIVKTLVAVAYHSLVEHIGDDTEAEGRRALTQLAKIYGVIA